jgi:hypothetical protein
MLNLPVHDAHDPLLRTPPTAAPVRPRQQPTGRRPDRPQGVRGLFAACADTFEGRRDTAVLMLLLTVPAERRWFGFALADVDLELDVLPVLGKDRRRGRCRSPSAPDCPGPPPARPGPDTE